MTIEVDVTWLSMHTGHMRASIDNDSKDSNYRFYVSISKSFRFRFQSSPQGRSTIVFKRIWGSCRFQIVPPWERETGRSKWMNRASVTALSQIHLKRHSCKQGLSHSCVEQSLVSMSRANQAVMCVLHRFVGLINISYSRLTCHLKNDTKQTRLTWEWQAASSSETIHGWEASNDCKKVTLLRRDGKINRFFWGGRQWFVSAVMGACA